MAGSGNRNPNIQTHRVCRDQSHGSRSAAGVADQPTWCGMLTVGADVADKHASGVPCQECLDLTEDGVPHPVCGHVSPRARR